MNANFYGHDRGQPHLLSMILAATALVMGGCQQNLPLKPSHGNDAPSEETAALTVMANPSMVYLHYTPSPGDLAVSREAYLNQLQGFWLGQCIANWTGLVTEMDKIGGAPGSGRILIGGSSWASGASTW